MKTYKRAILLSIFIYFIDALFYGQGGIALITAVIIVFFLFPKILVPPFGRRVYNFQNSQWGTMD